MADKRITDVDIIESLNGDESFFVNQNSSIKQINKNKIVDGIIGNTIFDIKNGGTGATTIAGARKNLGLGNTDGALPIENGGTGATTVAGARSLLGLGNTDGALPIENGGTGATTVADVRKRLGLIDTDGALSIESGGTGVKRKYISVQLTPTNTDLATFKEGEIRYYPYLGIAFVRIITKIDSVMTLDEGGTPLIGVAKVDDYEYYPSNLYPLTIRTSQPIAMTAFINKTGTIVVELAADGRAAPNEVYISGFWFVNQ